MPVMVDLHSGFSEALWIFSGLARFEDKNNCLPLEKNPHFYDRLFTSPKAHWAKFQRKPLRKFHNGMISVLIDNSDRSCRVFLEVEAGGQVRVFCNVWVINDALIFQGSCLISFIWGFSLSDNLLDVCGNLEGESIVGEAFRVPNVWCFEDHSSSLSPRLSLSNTIKNIVQITSPTAATKWDWRKPILRMLRFRDFDICFTNKPLESWISLSP